MCASRYLILKVEEIKYDLATCYFRSRAVIRTYSLTFNVSYHSSFCLLLCLYLSPGDTDEIKFIRKINAETDEDKRNYLSDTVQYPINETLTQVICRIRSNAF